MTIATIMTKTQIPIKPTKMVRLSPAATINDILHMLHHFSERNPGLGCYVDLKRGLRISYSPGKFLAISRLGQWPSVQEIDIVCQQAKASPFSILPEQATPAESSGRYAAVWMLEHIDL